MINTTEEAGPITTDVAIVGAGLVGLMIANILGLYGVRVLLIEKLEQSIDYPRAIGLNNESLRVFQAVGPADEVGDLPDSAPMNGGARAAGRCFASIEPRTDEFGWSRRNAFDQPMADQTLYQGLKRFPRTSVLFGHSVTSLSQDEEGVALTIENGQGVRREVRAA